MTDCKNCNYTDEYCASGECTSQSPRNGSQKGDLTSQWKKGELEKCKDYYVKYGDYEMSLTLDGDNDFIFYGRPIKPKVLAPVPSYEEYLEMEGHCGAYSDINQWQKKEISAYKRLVAELKQENTKLKELLKDCRSPINYALCLNLSEEEKIEFKNLLAKIKEALK